MKTDKLARLLAAAVVVLLLTLTFMVAMWPTRKPVYKADLPSLLNEFDALNGWDVRLVDSPKSCMTIVNSTNPEASIYACDLPVDDYLLHEVLHVAVRAAMRGKEIEESVVIDLTRMVKSGLAID